MSVAVNRVRCHVCEPSAEFDAELIFWHWKHVHGLDFEVFQVTPDGYEIDLMEAVEDPLRVYEVDLDRLEVQARALGRPMRWWYLAQIWWLRRSVAQHRANEIGAFLDRAARDG